MTTIAKSGLLGAPIRRREDPRLLTGRATYVADLRLPGTLHLAILRSPQAHARIVRVDTTAASRLAGVNLALGGGDIADELGPMPLGASAAGQRNARIYPLAIGKVVHAGQAVAAVVAESRHVAEDALEAIAVEYEVLPAVADAERAIAPDAPLLFEEWGENVGYRTSVGSGDVDAAFAEADLVFSERFRLHRYSGVSMETRGVVAHYDAASGLLTVWSSTQYPHAWRSVLAETLAMPETQIRCIAPEVGGAFGVKAHFYAEELLVPYLARRLGRPVQWIEDRIEHFLSTIHAREQIHDVEVAAKSDGTLLAIRDRLLADAGAFFHWVGPGPISVTSLTLPSIYQLRAYRCDVTVAMTNKVPYGAYRGFGAPQSTFVAERIMDLIAHRLGLDPAEVRMRNLIRPEQMPYRTASGMTIDSGDYPAALAKALEIVDYQGFRSEQARLRAEGRHVGLGIGCFAELTGMGPSPVRGRLGCTTGGWEQAIVRVEPTGSVTVLNGIAPNGQGHQTLFAQVCAHELGVPIDWVTVVTGDTATTCYTPMGAAGSRTAALAGSTIAMAARSVRAKVLRLAAHLLEASVDDLEIEEGRVVVRGSPDRSVSLKEVANAAWVAFALPPGEAPGIEARETYDPPGFAFSNAVHVAVVEVDVETGVLRILRYVVVHDCGRVLNPMLLAGQVLGGVAQGIGGALLEDLRYDENGQLLATTLMDYLCPTANEIPMVELDHLETPTPLFPNGAKGSGEGGLLGPAAALANAVSDALAPFGVEITQTPMSPPAIRAAIDRAQR